MREFVGIAFNEMLSIDEGGQLQPMSEVVLVGCDPQWSPSAEGMRPTRAFSEHRMSISIPGIRNAIEALLAQEKRMLELAADVKDVRVRVPEQAKDD